MQVDAVIKQNLGNSIDVGNKEANKIHANTDDVTVRRSAVGEIYVNTPALVSTDTPNLLTIGVDNQLLVSPVLVDQSACASAVSNAGNYIVGNKYILDFPAQGNFGTFSMILKAISADDLETAGTVIPNSSANRSFFGIVKLSTCQLVYLQDGLGNEVFGALNISKFAWFNANVSENTISESFTITNAMPTTPAFTFRRNVLKSGSFNLTGNPATSFDDNRIEGNSSLTYTNSVVSFSKNLISGGSSVSVSNVPSGNISENDFTESTAANISPPHDISIIRCSFRNDANLNLLKTGGSGTLTLSDLNVAGANLFVNGDGIGGTFRRSSFLSNSSATVIGNSDNFLIQDTLGTTGGSILINNSDNAVISGCSIMSGGSITYQTATLPVSQIGISNTVVSGLNSRITATGIFTGLVIRASNFLAGAILTVNGGTINIQQSTFAFSATRNIATSVNVALTSCKIDGALDVNSNTASVTLNAVSVSNSSTLTVSNQATAFNTAIVDVLNGGVLNATVDGSGVGNNQIVVNAGTLNLNGFNCNIANLQGLTTSTLTANVTNAFRNGYSAVLP